MSKYRVGDHALLKIRGGENVHIEMTMKSYIIISVQLSGFGDSPPSYPTAKCTMPEIFLCGLLAFASLTTL